MQDKHYNLRIGDTVEFKAGAFEKKTMYGTVKFLEPNGFYIVISNGQNYQIHCRDLKLRRLIIQEEENVFSEQPS